jgi:hypothetical protein
VETAAVRAAKEKYDTITSAAGEAQMADTHNVFISWSGERSRLAAEALNEWLSTVLQNARPWMSTEMEKGSRSFEEIGRALEGMKVGIICLTPENLTSEWIHYEAGALSKTTDARTRVCTYLLADLDSSNVKPPLSWFQWTKANQSDTRKLVGTINKHLDATPLEETRVDITFEKWWPDLERKLKALPAPPTTPPPPRSTDEMVAEILELSRAIAPDIQNIARETALTRNQRERQDAMTEWIATRAPGTFVFGGGPGSGKAWLSSLGGTTQLVPEVESSEGLAERPKRPHVGIRPRKPTKK